MVSTTTLSSPVDATPGTPHKKRRGLIRALSQRLSRRKHKNTDTSQTTVPTTTKLFVDDSPSVSSADDTKASSPPPSPGLARQVKAPSVVLTTGSMQDFEKPVSTENKTEPPTTTLSTAVANNVQDEIPSSLMTTTKADEKVVRLTTTLSTAVANDVRDEIPSSVMTTTKADEKVDIPSTPSMETNKAGQVAKELPVSPLKEPITSKEPITMDKKIPPTPHETPDMRMEVTGEETIMKASVKMTRPQEQEEETSVLSSVQIKVKSMVMELLAAILFTIFFVALLKIRTISSLTISDS